MFGYRYVSVKEGIQRGQGVQSDSTAVKRESYHSMMMSRHFFP